MKKKILFYSCLLGPVVSFGQFDRPVLKKQEAGQTLQLKTITPPANLTPGRDIAISIKSFQFDPANGSSVNVSYIVTNNGTEPLDINNVTVQGYIDGPTDYPTATPPNYPYNGKNYYPAGGLLLSSSSSILNPGQQTEGILRGFNLSRNNYFNNSNNYTYLLTVDAANKTADVNKNNNMATATFRGYQGQYQPSVSASQYYLTDAFVTIRTGADNKEKESAVNFRLIPSSAKNLVTDDRNEFVKRIAKNELPFFSNSVQTLPMLLFMSSTSTITNPATSLASFQQNGLGFIIEYKPNLVTDAWKIEQLELVLCFKDANGNYHPTEGRKKIVFSVPANTFLDGFFKHFLACKADASLNPVMVKVIERLSDF